MDNGNTKKGNTGNEKTVFYSNKETREEGVLDDVSVSSVKSSLTRRILVFLVGVFAIPLIVYAFSILVLPLLKSSTFAGVTLNYWGLWEDKNAMEKVIYDFERQHPNIKINYEKQDIKTLGKYVNRIATRINNKTGPDIFRYHNSWTMQIKDFLLPLPVDVVNELGLASGAYYDVIKKDINIAGASYGVPLEVDTLALFVNTEMLQSGGVGVPDTWNDLAKSARTLTVKEGRTKKIMRSGVAIGTFGNVDHASDIVALLMSQNGVNLYDFSSPDQAKNIESALVYYTSFAIGEEGVWDNTFENSKLAFAKGKVAMMFGYSWDIFEIKKVNPNLKFAVYPVPHLPGRNTTIASYWVEGVSSRTKYPKEAFEFLKFIAKKENLEKMYSDQSRVRLFGEPYPRRDMAGLLQNNNMIYPFVQQAPNSVSTPFSSDTYDDSMNRALNDYLGKSVDGLVSRSFSPESATETLVKGTSQILERYAH